MATRTDDAEDQPLLASQQPNYEGAENASVQVANSDRPADIVKRTSVWTAIWYIVLLTGGTLALVFFIKGFIDAGDVDVGLSRLSPGQNLTSLDSSILRGHSSVLWEVG